MNSFDFFKFQDNATEGVIWKARDLWSAPVERSSHGMQARKSNRLCSLRQGLAAGILQSAAAALPPSGSVSSSTAAPSPHHRVGCYMIVPLYHVHASAATALNSNWQNPAEPALDLRQYVVSCLRSARLDASAL